MGHLEGLAGLLGGNLHRRLFSSFGGAILLTFLSFLAVLRLTQWDHPNHRDMTRLGTFVAGRLAAVWDAPGGVEELATALESTMEVGLVVKDTHENVTHRSTGCELALRPVAVVRGEETLGSVEVCPHARPLRLPLRFVFPFVLACLVLWALSGRVARRLTQPLEDAVRVAQEIGQGNLAARAKLSPGAPGEVGSLAWVLNDMAAKIEQQLAAQKELLAGVSHELRTPLARIRLLIELARDPEAAPHHLDEVDKEVEEVDALVGDLLASSRLEFKAMRMESSPAQAVAARGLERAGLDPKLLVANVTTPVLRGDLTLLGRALHNLLVNAVEHGGGVAELRVREVEGAVAFEVLDQGAGFDPAELGRVFEPFFRGQKGSHAGLGLGLSLVARIAVAHGGRAYACNEEPRGARVGFEVACG